MRSTVYKIKKCTKYEVAFKFQTNKKIRKCLNINKNKQFNVYFYSIGYLTV